jgi:hypothetical protein
MKNVDVEIYISNLITFFDKNPNDLMELIGKSQKEEFFVKLREKCELNFKEGKDVVLTKEQIIDVVLELKLHIAKGEKITKITTAIQKTKFGDIILN